MKKKIIVLFVSIISLFCFISCGGKTSSVPGDSTGSGNSQSSSDGVKLLDLGSEFDENYYPDLSSMESAEGQIDVVILFDGTQDGWKAVADEYMRLHENSVYVKLNTTYTASTYGDKLLAEVKDKNTEWDIVQGNLIGNNLTQYCYNMSSTIRQANAYAGEDTSWKDVLSEEAYLTDKSGANTDCFILNTESLNTAWFVNDVALKAAGEKGYKNVDGKVATPKTWDDLVALCKYMKEAGYANPLGISVDTESISASQFTWLLRIYGDLYFRSDYNVIMPQEGDENFTHKYEVDLTSENPESAVDYGYVYSRFFNTILDQSSKNYVGATSGKYKDFLSQFEKIKEYLLTDAASTSMEQMRNMFRTQSSGKASPQIMLDYSGEGLAFGEKSDESFSLDFFDYPRMVSEYVSENTLVRDVGGNGGYLSIVNHGKTQNALNVDFLKFFLSPYGQTIYYKALSEKGVSVKGLTTVKNNLVVVPESWKTFFRSDKISYTGLADNNPYLTFLVRYMSNDTDNVKDSVTLWKRYLTGTGADALTTDSFGSVWQSSLLSAFERLCDVQGWSKTFYKYPGKGVDYGN